MTAESTQMKKFTLNDLQKHSTRDDCWIVVHQKVWDITSFIDEHPGGPAVILKYAGKNATSLYDAVHAPDIITEELPKDKLMGLLEDVSPADGDIQATPEPKQVPKPVLTAVEDSSVVEEDDGIPPLSGILSCKDFEIAASKALTPKTWAFYSSAATDLVTHRQNKEVTRRIMLRPRILRNVSNVDMKTTILGNPVSAPFFISPAAMARLAHPDGELALSLASSNQGIIQTISSNASFPMRTIMGVAPPEYPFFFQLYVNSERKKTEEILKTARNLGIKAILVTVDAPVPGKREADERAAQEGTVRSAISGGESSKDKKGSGFGRLMAQYIDKSLNWDDLAWLRRMCGDMKIVLKGVQTADDVKIAAEYGCDAVVLSNHGGRSLDGSQPSILVLMEVRRRYPHLLEKLEVYVDGGFERGSDILKALALGAKAVGIGRPYMYSLVYGQEGAEHLTEILKDELETSMRLAGLSSLNEITPRLVNTRDVDHLVDTGEDSSIVRSKL